MKLKVAEYRKARGLTQEELGNVTGLGQPAISRIERMARGIRLDHLETLAQFFHVPVSELINEDNSAGEFSEFFKHFSSLPEDTKRSLMTLAMSSRGAEN